MTTQPPASYDVRAVEASALWALRQRVLRPHQTIDQMRYPGDDDPDTAHFAAFAPGEGAPAAIVSLYRAPLRDGPPRAVLSGDWALVAQGQDAWQFRAMASAPEHRGRGAGAAVLAGLIAHARARGGKLLWCNARLGAVGFYERFGMGVVGERFEIPQIGPHVVMVLALDRA